MPEPSKKQVVGVHNLHPNILGLDPVHEGRLRLSQWNQRDKLPLPALADEILTYIDARIVALGGGSGTVADAVNYHGSASINSGSSANLILETVTDWKLRGFYAYTQDGDGEVTLTYTGPSGVVSVKFSLASVMRTGWFLFPNPIPITDSTTVTLAIENTTGTSPLSYYGAVFGEEAV